MTKLVILDRKIGRLLGRRKVEYSFYTSKSMDESPSSLVNLVRSVPSGSNAFFAEQAGSEGGGTDWVNYHNLSFYRVTQKQRKNLLSNQRAKREKERLAKWREYEESGGDVAQREAFARLCETHGHDYACKNFGRSSQI